jgi:hypothetical protein
MRISFDLDDTLICYGGVTPCEPAPAWYWRWVTTDEPLRLGARSLLRTLNEQGWEVWINTTSRRSPGSVKRWLKGYDIHIAEVVNQDIHEQHFRRSGNEYPPTKNPGAFGIDLHVDDSQGVRIEGERYGCRVLVVSPSDESWAQKVLAAVDQVSKQGE